MEFNVKRLLELYEEEGQKTAAVKKYCAENQIEFNETIRKRASEKMVVNKTPSIDKDFDNETDTVTNQYANDKEEKTFYMPSAWDKEKNKFLSIDEYCDKYNLPKDQVRSSKLISHIAGHITYNVAFNGATDEEATLDFDFFDELVQKHISPVKVEVASNSVNNDYFDRLVYTDVHIGMSVDGGRNTVPLYEGVWGKEELLSRLDVMIKHTLQFRKGSVLFIDELGDFCDGLFGYTTRGGHELPQNMNDKEVFELGVEFKIRLIEELLPYYEKIVCNSIIADNHSFMFAYFVNSAVQKIIENKYPNVEFHILEKFINHYSVGKHTLVLSHGKENEALKFGFKPILDRKQADKIDQYCKEYKLYNGNHIEFSKGDSHQAMSDFSTSNDFAYCNYPAFSPPSNWVKTNFSLSREGFSFFNIDKNSNIKVHIPYWFR